MNGVFNTPPEIAPQVAEQAVSWLVEMQGGALSPRRQRAWQQWLDAHAEHQRAWDHIQRVNQRLRGLSSPLAHAALNAPQTRTRRQALKLLLLLGAGSAMTYGLREQLPLTPLLADYSSPIGQRRTVNLHDGSQIRLNTGSSVDVRFDAQQRLIRLLDGEVQMTVAQEARPLHVHTAHGVLQPDKARFNLRQFRDRTHIAVFEGRVQLAPQAYPGSPLQLEAHQQVSFTHQAWSTPHALDAGSGAWADGVLVAAHMRLEDFIAELSRYRRGQLHCDPKVANLLISGTYPIDDTERVLDLLHVSLPVRVKRFTRYWVTVESNV